MLFVYFRFINMRLLFVILTLLLVSLGSAAANTDAAEELRATIDRTLDLYYAETSRALPAEALRNQVTASFEAEYDMTVIVRRCIGRNWKRLDASQQSRINELFKELVGRAFLQALAGQERPQIEIGKVVTLSKNRIEIPSKLLLKGEPVNVVYRMGLMKSGWEIFDIVAEDISFVSNYRQQMDDHFRKGNGDQLIEKLEQLAQKEVLDEAIRL